MWTPAFWGGKGEERSFRRASRFFRFFFPLPYSFIRKLKVQGNLPPLERTVERMV